jgi:hypothetical protein
MYNIAKVGKGEVLRFFNEIFDALCKVRYPFLLVDSTNTSSYQPTPSCPSRMAQSC